MRSVNHAERRPALKPAIPNGSAASGLLKERAYAEIKRRILGGQFAPSTFLSERQLAAQLAMSKTPIRAALARLELEGFVTISPQQGVIVRDLAVGEIADLYEIRVALETYVLRSLAGRLTPAQVVRIEVNLKAQAVVCENFDVERGVELDRDFHRLFCEFLGNREIVRVMSQLDEKFHRVVSQVFQLSPKRMTDSYAEHRGLAEAVISGDGELAARRIEEHLEYGKRCLLSPRG